MRVLGKTTDRPEQERSQKKSRRKETAEVQFSHRERVRKMRDGEL